MKARAKIASVAGFLLSAPLRWLYRRLWDVGPRAMLVGSALACWLVALAWRAIMNTAYMRIVKPEGAVEHPPQPLEIFVGTLASMALLLCWTGLYYGIKFYERLQLERMCKCHNRANDHPVFRESLDSIDK
jgi:hypothetical protein